MHARGLLRAAPALAAALALLAPIAAAHVPSIDPGDRVIDDASRSWAFYDELPPGAAHTWTFTLQRGEPLFISVSVPTGATWTPEATLTGPTGDIPLERVDGIGFEPATPYASREAWSLDETAPAGGEYTLTITGEGGPYALGFGLAERFTPQEWVTIPIAAARIHRWEGQSAWWIALPYALGIAALALPGAPRAPARPLLPRVAAGLFLGTALDRGIQIGRAFAAGGMPPAWGWAFTLVFLLAALGLAVAAWRARSPLALALIGIVGLVTWAGFLLGPFVAFVAAAERAWRGVSRLRRGGEAAR